MGGKKREREREGERVREGGRHWTDRKKTRDREKCFVSLSASLPTSLFFLSSALSLSLFPLICRLSIIINAHLMPGRARITERNGRPLHGML